MDVEKFKALNKEDTEEQLKIFVRSFGSKENVDLEEMILFANYFSSVCAGRTELDLTQAGVVAEHIDRGLTPIALKKEMRTYDADNNGKMSFLEFALWFYKMDLDDCGCLFEDHDADPAILKALADAKAAVQASDDAKKKLEDETEKCKAKAEEGGTKAFGANQRITAIEEEQKELKFARIKLQKTLDKAQVARDTAPSLCAAKLEELAFKGFHRDYQPKLHAKYPKFPKDLD